MILVEAADGASVVRESGGSASRQVAGPEPAFGRGDVRKPA
jgi:hypothetical protein